MEPLLLLQKIETKSRVTLPFVSIALQIDSMSTTKEQLGQKIKLSLERVENELRLSDGIPEYMVLPALNKLKGILDTLDNSANKKSVVIFLAPFMEKVYYLNFLLKEKVVVGEPFNIRQLILTKREEIKYLVLSLHADRCYIYLGQGKELSLIVFNSADHLKSHYYAGEEKFLLHVDNVLAHILRTYLLPLIAVGTQEMLSLFASVSRNSNELIKTVYSTEDLEKLSSVQQLITPEIANWEELKEHYLLMKLQTAIQTKKAEIGIHQVCKAAKDKRGKLLIVEKDFYYSSRSDDANWSVRAQTFSSNGSLGNDAVADAIEHVLAAGGNIEFVNRGVLSDYLHIALIV